MIREDRSTGSFPHKKYIFNLRPLGNGVHVLIKRDPTKAPADEPPEFKKVEKEAEGKQPPPAPQADVPPGNRAVEVDLLVLYTPEVAKNHVDVPLFVDSVVEIYANPTFQRSGIPLKVSAAHIQQVDYTESGSVATDVARLRQKTDNHLDDVHVLRDTHKASRSRELCACLPAVCTCDRCKHA